MLRISLLILGVFLLFGQKALAAQVPSAPTISGPAYHEFRGTYNYSWNNPGGSVSSYKVEKSWKPDRTGNASVSTVTYSSTGYSETFTEPGTYVAKVRACNSAGCSGWSNNEVNIIRKHWKPNQTVANGPSSSSTGRFQLTWSKPWGHGINNYIVERAANGGGFGQVQSGASMSMQQSLSNGTYTYRINVCNEDNVCSGFGPTKQVVVDIPPPRPSTPSEPDVAWDLYHPQGGSIRVHVPSISGATSYTIYNDTTTSGRAQSRNVGTGWTTIPAVGVGHNYIRIAACNRSGCSESVPRRVVIFSAPHSVSPSINKSIANKNDSVTISWGLPAGTIWSGAYFKVHCRTRAHGDVCNQTIPYQGSSNQTAFSHTFTASHVAGYDIQVLSCNESDSHCSSGGTGTVHVLPPVHGHPKFNLDFDFYYPINTDIPLILASGIAGADSFSASINGSIVKYLPASGIGTIQIGTIGKHQLSMRACVTTPSGSRQCSAPSVSQEISIFNHKPTAVTVELSNNAPDLGQATTLKWRAPSDMIWEKSYFKVHCLNQAGVDFCNNTINYRGDMPADFSQSLTFNQHDAYSISVKACNKTTAYCSTSNTLQANLLPAVPGDPGSNIGWVVNYPLNSEIKVAIPQEVAGAESFAIYYYQRNSNPIKIAQVPVTQSTYTIKANKLGKYTLQLASCVGVANPVCSAPSMKRGIDVYTIPEPVTGKFVTEKVSVGPNSALELTISGQLLWNKSYFKVACFSPSGEQVCSQSVMYPENMPIRFNVNVEFKEVGIHTIKLQVCNETDAYCSAVTTMSVDVLPMVPVKPESNVMGDFYYLENSMMRVYLSDNVTGATSFQVHYGKGEELTFNKNVPVSQGYVDVPVGAEGVHLLSLASCMTSSTGAKKCSEQSETQNIVVYVTPHPVLPKLSKSKVRTSEKVTLTWTQPAGTIYESAVYKVACTLEGDPNNHCLPEEPIRQIGKQTDHSYEFRLTKPGDYKIRVQSCNDARHCSAQGYVALKVIQSDIPIPVIDAPARTFLNAKERVKWSFATPPKTAFDTTLFVKAPDSTEPVKLASQPQNKAGEYTYSFNTAGTYRFYAQACGEVDNANEVVPIVNNDIFIPITQNAGTSRVCSELDASEVTVAVMNTEFALKNTDGKLTWSTVAGATSFEIESAVCASRCDDLSALNWTWLATLTDGQSSYNITPAKDKIYRIKVCFSDGTCAYVVEGAPAGKGYAFSNTDFAKTNDSQSIQLPNNGVGTITATTGGQFRVDESGNATYQIPFELPVGPGGIRPSLGLGYSSSNTRQGIAGIGWSLSGISAITRCAKSRFYDDLPSTIYVEKVKLDGTTFCLNGQRLIKVEPSVYRTESDDFTEYRIHRSSAVIIGFEATTKSGETHYYGNINSATSAVQSALISEQMNYSIPHTWVLSSIVDTYNNTINYHYTSPAGSDINTESILDSITYGQTKVQLNYSDSEGFYGYRFGRLYSRTQALTSVAVTYNNSAVRYYGLAYSSNDNTYLNSITLCKSSSGGCTKPVSFEWEKEVANWSTSNPKTVGLGSRDKVGIAVTGDLNGDGASDFITYEGDGRWDVEYGNNQGRDSLTIANTDPSHAAQAIVADFNGDGRADVLLSAKNRHGNNVQWYLMHQEGERTSTEVCDVYNWDPRNQFPIEPSEPLCYTKITVGELKSYQVLNTAKLSKVKPADVNGDGIMDITHMTSKAINYHINTLNSNTGVVTFSSGRALGVGSLPGTTDGTVTILDHFWGEVDGDGRSDVIIRGTETEYVCSSKNDDPGDPNCEIELVSDKLYKAVNIGNGFGMAIIAKSNIGFSGFKVADVNGDGLIDVLYKQRLSWYLQLNNGYSFETPTEMLAGKNVHKNDLIVMDYDADLAQELLVYNDNRSMWFVYNYNALDGTFEELTNSSVNIARYDTNDIKDTMLFADYDGDGLMDWIRVRYQSPNVQAHIFYRANTNKKHRTIHHFVDGLGNKTTVEYKPLTDNSVYEGTVESQFPIISARGPSYVVSKATSPDGTGDRSSVQYRYANMAFHGQGRGYLGFGKLTTIDERDNDYNMVTETYYHQGFDENEAVKSYLKYPELVGMPVMTQQKMVKKSDQNSVIVLSESRNQYGITETASTIDSKVKRNPYSTHIQKSIEQSYFLNGGTSGTEYSSGGLNSTSTTVQGYDTWGNLLSSIITLNNADDSTVFITKTVNEYTASPVHCANSRVNQNFDGNSYERFGRLTCSTVTKTRVNNGVSTSSSKSSAFGYDANGILSQEQANVHSANQSILTTYTFNGFGLKNSTTVVGSDLSAHASIENAPSVAGDLSRTSTTVYDTSGRFVLSKTNQLGHTVCYDVDNVTGLLKSKTTNVFDCTDQSIAQGLTTQYRYNALGQPTGEISPNGIKKSISRYFESASNSTKRFSEKVQTHGGHYTKTTYDMLGRAIKVQKSTFDANKEAITLTQYDKFGNGYKTSVVGSSASIGNDKYQISEFDILGRVINTTTPSFNGTALSVATRYSGSTTTETHSGGTQSVVKQNVYNVAGELLSTTDNVNAESGATSSQIAYAYDAYGQLLNTTDSGSNKVVMEYDNLGNKIKTVDPDKGTWHYRYNALGQLRWQKDAKGQVTWFNYDVLGRTTHRIDNAQSSARESRCYYYDMGGILGAKDEERVFDGGSCSVDANLTFSRSFIYDGFGRPIQQDTTIYKGDTPFVQTQYTHYDALGRVYLSQLSDNYAVGYKYNARGFKISEHGLRYNNDTMKVDETLLKTINSVNFRGQVTKETYLGNQVLTYGYDSYTGLSDSLGAVGMHTESGQNSLSASYQYNAFGQLNKREFTGLYDQTRTETFTYDGLNRLSTATNRYGTLSNTLNYCYDALGNMLKKGSTSTCGVGSNDFSYGSSTRSTGNAGPHALLKDLRTGTSRTFNYDNNGNVTGDGDRSFVYSGFDKVTQIHQAGNMQVNFAYDANMRRYYRKDAYSTQNETEGKVDTETFYLGAFEHITKGSGPSGGNTIYQYTLGNMQISENLATGDITQKLMIRDHLGSVLAVSEVNAAKTAASITQTFRYDPFGQQFALQANTAQTNTFSAFTGYMRQGFTGHEMLNGLNVIHMNGRIYDPTIGRFLQADPHIQAPSNSQSYNRYSYVLNNPLSYTDPSGYFFKKLGKFIKKNWRTIAAIAITAVTGYGVQLFTAFEAYGVAAIVAASGGALAGYIATGSIKGAVVGALSGAAFYGIGQAFNASSGFFQTGGAGHVGSHALAGGVIADLQGGKFGHGFMSAGITKFAQVNGMASGDLSTGIVKSAIIGGTVSRVTGGKFGNGAVTAAFQFAMNQWIEERLKLFSSDPYANDKEFQRLKAVALNRNLQEIQMSEYRASVNNGSDPYTKSSFGSVIYKNDDGYRLDNNKSASPRIPYGYVTNEGRSGLFQLVNRGETLISNAHAIIITTPSSPLSIANASVTYLNFSEKMNVPVYVNSTRGVIGDVYVFDSSKSK
ncbi:hypothetical protein BGP78_17785 [Pseudoalteromonas sp. MSK9-3]|uniref:RHS repeat-associated core domain-containing protein n=1 Tax=Pseudoalteromonas sp. MSK9-3 TaxID=1897633 RepID=UPI000ED2F3BE|nr:RHS repeat-associated core domain-containing protein [Pseudoalteromonas sp. MSK9-3]RJE73822.1 hypothetical protein BGP78_17785 [Pseudoalteromonas sp. MSK9-3]